MQYHPEAISGNLLGRSNTPARKQLPRRPSQRQANNVTIQMQIPIVIEAAQLHDVQKLVQA